MNLIFPCLRYPNRLQNWTMQYKTYAYIWTFTCLTCYKSESLSDQINGFFFSISFSFLACLVSHTECSLALYYSLYLLGSIIDTFLKNISISKSLKCFEKNFLKGTRYFSLTIKKEYMPVEWNSFNKIKVGWCLADWVTNNKEAWTIVILFPFPMFF